MRGLDLIAPLVAAAGLAGFAATFAVEQRAFRAAVAGWAERDLASRASLAASTLAEPLATSDFRRIHAFGGECTADGVRLTVLSRGGGVFFDTLRPGEPETEAVYETAPCGEFIVRLGLPLERVLAPFNRAKTGFLLAALAGAAGVGLLFLVTYRQSVRIRELKRLENFRREFVADVSHEIKTPLTGILGAVDMLADCPEDRRATLLAMAKREAARLNALAQNILDLARLERENHPLEKTPVSPDDIVAETLQRFAAKAADAGVILAGRPGAAACAAPVAMDAALVSQALANLVENAIRHSGSRDVLVWAEAAGREVSFVVEDHGRGIPPEHAGRIFERFHRVDAARSSETGGAGLGLAIVRRIARLHGGDVALSRAAPSGCRFTLSLPAERRG